MKPSPLELYDYKLTCLRIEQAGSERSMSPKRSDGRVSLDDAKVRASVDIGEPDAPSGEEGDARHFAIRLRIFVQPEPGKAFPYTIEVGLEGFFAVHGNDEPADARALAAVNGTSVLYGVARDVVLTQTMRFGEGAVMLPSVHFLDLKKFAQDKAFDESTESLTDQAEGTTAAEKKVARAAKVSRRRERK